MLPTPTLPSSQADLNLLAARVMVGTAWTAAVLLLGSALVNELAGNATRFSHLRGLYGLVMLVAALLGQWQWQRRPRLASAGTLVAGMVAAWAHVLITGIGLHAQILTAALLAIVLSGVLCNSATAIVFALGNALMAIAAYVGESRGWLRGLAAAADLQPGERLAGQLLFTAVALMSSLLLARLLNSSLGRALDHEQRLSELVRIGSDWTWEMDPQGRTTFLSPSFEARTGRPAREFLHGSPGGGLQPDNDEAWQAMRDDLRLQRPFRDRLFSYRCNDGTALTVLSHGDPVRDANGQCIGWRGVSRNVTAEQRLRQAQARTQSLLDRLVQTSPDAICVMRLSDGAIVLANPPFLQMAGRREDEVLGRSAGQLGLWRDPGFAEQLVAALRRDGLVRDLRSDVHTGRGPRPMVLTAATFEWDRAPVAVLTTRDIADIERARAEADAVLDHASVGIARVRHWRFERTNPPFEAAFGHPAGSLVGQSAAVLFASAADFDAFSQRADEAHRAGQTIDIERDTLRPDGRAVLVRLRARAVDPLRPLEGGAIWVAEDITEHRQAERELAAAKQQAESANQAKSAFLATMSHEIRTPLNGVLGLARLMQDPDIDDYRRREYLGHLLAAAEHLSGIVSDVLDLSKIEAGHLQFEAIGFDLHVLADSTFATFAPLGRERGLFMHCRIDAGVPQRVLGDPLRVRQIIANYLGNALKFTNRGEISLRLRYIDDGRVRIEVADTGPGVDPALRDQLFHPFTQADTSTTRRYGGTGLGLSICRQLAEHMGGRVGVDSDGLNGSRFWAELALPPEAGSARAAAGDEDRLPLAGLTVLVAEDNAVNMLIVGAMLRRQGAQVIEAHDGEEAALELEDGDTPIHIVLMDLHMPVLDGLAATRRLRAGRSRGRALPIYALSAAVLDQERQDAGAAGMNGFIAKPVLEAELLRVLLPHVPRGGR